MKKISISILFFLRTAYSMANPEVYSCSEGFSKRLSEAHETVKSHVEEMAQKAETIYLNLVETYNTPANSKSYQKLSNMLSCIRDKIIQGGYAYRCAKGGVCDGVAAYIRGSDTALNHFLKLGSVKFCEQAFPYYSEPKKLEGVIVHEVAHLCLAGDKQYFNGLNHEAMQKSFWLKNADTYYNIYYYKDQLY